MSAAFASLFARDVRLAFRQGGAPLMAVMFFVITVSLFPLAIGFDAVLLTRIGPGVIWVAALLAALLTLDRLFQADFEDGNLDLLAASGLTMYEVAIAKILAHWATTGIALVIASPLLAIFMNLPPASFGILALAMLAGTLVLSLIGAIGAALTAGLRRGGVLMALLVLPFNVPVLIFGTAAVEATVIGANPWPMLMILAALALAGLVLAPLAAAAALRLALE